MKSCLLWTQSQSFPLIYSLHYEDRRVCPNSFYFHKLHPFFTLSSFWYFNFHSPNTFQVSSKVFGEPLGRFILDFETTINKDKTKILLWKSEFKIYKILDVFFWSLVRSRLLAAAAFVVSTWKHKDQYETTGVERLFQTEPGWGQTFGCNL